MEALELISQVKLFSTAPVSVLQGLAEKATPIDLAAGQLLARKGDYGTSLYLVAAGTLKVHDGEVEFVHISRPDVVGEFSLLDTEPRSASITALEPSRVFELTHDNFFDVIDGHPEVLKGVLRHLVGRMRQQNEQLERKVQERTHDLSASVEETIAERNRLVELNERKNEIIRIVSHDIRSPISGIGSLAKLLKDDKDIAKDLATVQEYAALIHNSATSISSFVNEILDLAKLESGTSELKQDRLDLNDLLKAQYSTFEPVTLTKGVKLVVEAQPGTVVLGDRTALGQAFNNLIANAIKFTPKGGTVTLRLGQHAAGAQPQATVEIADTGIGIPPESLPHLFDKFSKAQRAGTKGEKGTGLGMSIAKQILELHKGTIEVASTVGKGTTFTLRLPLAA
ncbi:MAG: ATP-binding protein [Bacteroidia bacterium]|nr:ATP-binding protein [Bacteroidia bacterium]